MELFEQIRRASVRDEESIRGLAKRFGVHRRDVRAALASAVPAPRKTAVRSAPKLDLFKPIIDGWLKEDRNVPRKQRHTARRVWQRLVAEHDADIGESTVRRYVAAVKAAQGTVPAQVTVPQHHVLGAEAEVDFGEAHIYLNGVLIKVAVFVMRLSASGRSFARAYLSEAQEVFLDGHVRAFQHFGGVPGQVRYDNLKAAVTKVLKGRSRVEADRFVALRSHYRFDSFFCVAGIEGAHEKGGVEGEVGRFRRRHLVPIPRVSSMAELNELIDAAMITDDGRVITGRRATIGEHFVLEAEALAVLPAEGPFDVSVTGSHRVDTKLRVSVRSVYYSVPARFARRRLDVSVGASDVAILDGANVVAVHARGRKGDEVLTLDHYLEVLATKPGAMASSIPLRAAKAAGTFTKTHDEFWSAARRRLGDGAGTRALIEVLLAHRTINAEHLVEGMTRALSAGSIDPNVVVIEARAAAEPAIAEVINLAEHAAGFDRPAPSLTNYDTLLEHTP